MNAYWKQFAKAIGSRKQEERVLLLLVVLVAIVYLGFVLVIEPLQQRRADIERRVTVVNAQILEEVNKQTEINATYSADPDSFARTRQAELRSAIAAADAELDQLYGQLIDPREMSLMLTSILQRDTSLELVSLSNKPGQLLLTAPVSAGGEGRATNVELYRHGLQLVFEGSYLDTVRYLKSLESLQDNFFWETLKYEVREYPKARITLDIYTLSTQQGWIGV